MYLSPTPRPPNNPGHAKTRQFRGAPGAAGVAVGSAALRRPSSEASTNNAVVRSLVAVPSRDTNPAPETPIAQAAAVSTRRSGERSGRNTWHAIASSNAALTPCTAPMMNATTRGAALRGDEISP